MNVLSLFDGMSCCYLALDKNGIKPTNYYAAEIDKFAIKASQVINPETHLMGSVTDWRDWSINLSTIDLVTGGFPCQAWSMAGKQLGDKDERGALFWVMLDIMQAVLRANPKAKFLIENVKMKKEFEEYITFHTEKALGKVHKILINSALVSAQNRNRYYWCNWHVEQPVDKGILLRDIIEREVSDELNTPTPKNHIGGNQLNPNYKSQANTIHNLNNKSPTLCANTHGYALGHIPRPCEPKPFDENSLCHHAADATDIKGHGYNKRVYAESGKAPTLAASSGGNLEPKVLCGAVRGRYNQNGKTQQSLEIRKDERSNALTTVQKDNVVIRQKSKCVRSGGRGSTDRHEWDSISNCHYRKLTPIECARLQTVPDEIIHKLIDAGISNTQLYKMLGNGWTIDVIAHIFSSMELPIQVFARQLSLFEDAA